METSEPESEQPESVSAEVVMAPVGKRRKRKLFPPSQETPQIGDSAMDVCDVPLCRKDSRSQLGSETKRICRKLFSENTDDCASPILTLPNELLAHLVLYLKPREIGRLATTCRRMFSIIGQNFLWRALCRGHFPNWNDRLFDENSDTCTSSRSSLVGPYIGSTWKRQYVLNSTRGIFYQNLGGGGRGKSINQIMDTPTAYGFRKMCCSRDHVFALDFSGILHVYRSRWEKNPVTNEFSYQRATWHREFSKHVVDITTDQRYDNTHRRYVYVLSQSLGMRNKRTLNTRSSSSDPLSGTSVDKDGVPTSGDKIDVFDERSCRRVFNMTFDPEMRFTAMQLTSAEAQQKTLYMLTDAGKVYSLHLFEPSLLNLGTEGIQVTLKSASKCLGEKVKVVKTSVGIVAFITVSGKLHLITQKPGEYYDLFGREKSAKLGVPIHINHIAKVVRCSIGDRHMGFMDEYGRAFVFGNNRYGQLGTGDRMDRASPTQVLCNRNIRILHCSLNHTLAVIETRDNCAVFGTGCGNNGRLPGKGRGCVEFVKLDIKIPWSTRQIDTHKECVFVLSCCDVTEEDEFEKRGEQNDVTKNNAFFSSQKSLQELIIDMKKTSILAEKFRILEAMIEKVSKNGQTRATESSLGPLKPIGQSSLVTSQSIVKRQSCPSNEMEMKALRNAAELLRHEVERVQLDIEILKQKS